MLNTYTLLLAFLNFMLLLFHTVRALHGETPVGIAFKSGKKNLINLLDKDHLLPRKAGPILEDFIVEVRYLHTNMYSVTVIWTKAYVYIYLITRLIISYES